MAVTKNVSEKNLKTYSATWNGVTIGYVKDVDPGELEMETVDLFIQEIGDNVLLDQVIVGMKGMVKLVIEQTTAAIIKSMMPWGSGTGAFPLTPAAFQQSMYALSKPLIIHPNGNGDASEDMTILKAFPRFKYPKGSDGKTFRQMPVSFMPFPDQGVLAGGVAPVYGYIGPPPG